jgi:integrase-like protein
MRSWRTAWRRLTREAGLSGLRFHDLRHHAITELAESTTSDQTIMSIAGHVSPRMLAHYSHVRLEAKRKALANLSSSPQEGSHVTIDVTNGAEKENNEPQLTENMVDVTGIEPVTPCLQRTGVLSNRSLPYSGFQCFQQFGESAFRSKLNPMQ